MFNVVISTDGACSGNPGPGGYAAIIRMGKYSKVISGYKENTTNNQMELRAVIEAVRALTKPCNILIRTDSQYVCTGIANKTDWANRNWRTKSGAKCVNYPMWQELTHLELEGKHSIRFERIEGHAGDPDNEQCDKIAKGQILLHKGE